MGPRCAEFRKFCRFRADCSGMPISPVGQSSGSMLAAIELQYAIAAKVLKTTDANAKAALALLADAVALSQDLAHGVDGQPNGLRINEVA